ncbi:MAG: MBOAT family protein [Myxococcales bacterium]|nr:MBOAT family protein [Myxococcales bacterium]
MNYNTLGFWLFFLAVFVPYWRLSHRGQNRLMLGASYVFYGFWDYRFLFLVLFSTIIDFVGGLGVAGVALSRRALRRLGALVIGAGFLLCSGIDYELLRRGLETHNASAVRAALPQSLADLWIPFSLVALSLAYGFVLPTLMRLPEVRRRKVFLVISMIANLGLLGFFKYFDFFVGSFATLLDRMGMSTSLHTLGILLPAGISFYTFQAMSYTIDIYRGDAQPTRDFGDFALFVCFFPHLIAGPIMRAHTLLPQVVEPRTVTRQMMREGTWLIAVGLFRKVVIADNLAQVANAIFFPYGAGQGSGLHGPETLVGIYAFALQIYGDFSGYSSMARGISKFFGYELVVNFNQPYLAQSPSDFWKRWHISLSTWLRDYLYIPLGGNRGGNRKLYRNLMITMLLGGLWHGASWTFVAWGFFHGIVLCLFRVLQIPDTVPEGAFGATWRRPLRILGMFHLTCVGWLLFRADNFQAAYHMAGRVLTDFHYTPFVGSALALMAFLAFPLLFIERLIEGERRIERVGAWPWTGRALAYVYVVVMVLFFHAEKAVEFIYFQF